MGGISKDWVEQLNNDDISNEGQKDKHINIQMIMGFEKLHGEPTIWRARCGLGVWGKQIRHT